MKFEFFHVSSAKDTDRLRSDCAVGYYLPKDRA